jgi:hypothetical protein
MLAPLFYFFFIRRRRDLQGRLPEGIEVKIAHVEVCEMIRFGLEGLRGNFDV